MQILREHGYNQRRVIIIGYGAAGTQEKMARRVAYDLHYIKHWSFWMDVKIILWTAFKGWTDRNAF